MPLSCSRRPAAEHRRLPAAGAPDTRMSFWSYLGDILTKYEQKCNIFKMSMSKNYRNGNFSEIKAPQGATRHKGASENLPQENKFNFIIISKMDFFQKSGNLIEIYLSNSLFYRKPKWSVWSIGTCSTTRNWKLMIQKVSYGGKLKF